MSQAVFILCAVTSLTCAVLLLRSWWRSRARLLFWSALCFVGLMGNNVMLMADQLDLVAADLSAANKIPALVGLAIFAFGLIWEDE